VPVDELSPDAYRWTPLLGPDQEEWTESFSVEGYLDRIDGQHFDRQGQPISLRQWAQLFEDESYKRVAEDHLDDGRVWVSTVWLGFNHNWGSGPPLIFETMVFVRHSEEQMARRRQWWIENMEREPHHFPWEDLECRRWSTEQQALIGHTETVQGLGPLMQLFPEDWTSDD
jgi:hypothetical protein